MDNLLVKADNLGGLEWLLESGYKETIDLIYIDPPFGTNNLFSVSEGRNNSISRKNDGIVAYNDHYELGDYLAFLKERLIMAKKLLSDQGSLYLHIDYKVGHYVKVLLDELFGIDNFRADISRIKCNPKNFKRKGYGNIKDLILFYTKTSQYIWNEPRQAYTLDQIEKLFPKKDPKGHHYTTVPLHAPGETRDGATAKPWRGMPPPEGRHWRANPEELEELDKQNKIEWSKNGVPRKKVYAYEKLEEGVKRQDIWTFKDPQHPAYPTEKNLEMLRTIVAASSKPNSLVLDFFCGSGTFLEAAYSKGRRFIGIDQSEVAHQAIQQRFRQALIADYTFRDLAAAGKAVE